MERNIAQEELNKQIVKDTLARSAQDFTIFFKDLFIEDVEWTIAGHGPVAGTYYGMQQLFEKAEDALYQRLAKPLAVTTIGVWAEGNEVFARIKSTSEAIDGRPYGNEYMYIMTIKDGKVVSGIEWLDLDAYYDIVNRIQL
ncbi:nuclear transport factor 2 family protein [Mucilaginibacter sp. JRF]|uniref:nuclear transport factor 2 family protein n=1 Tax=Mucilaginibacter sp. JRF TaxID=2780088 RepID=UPI0018813513|nr:nuclear transport factor 2 family protein [Mucilaginibacter sp. JRF]MBE9583322.1 nuclear transport factor 2 family protein [Mucilaginibacter sp. JRF]